MKARVLFSTACLVAVVGMLWGSVTPAHACSCAGYPLETNVVRASTVVTGTVTDVTIVPPINESAPDAVVHQLIVSFAVEKYFKGGGPAFLSMVEPGVTYSFSPDGKLQGARGRPLFDEASKGQFWALFLREGSDLLTTPILLLGLVQWLISHGRCDAGPAEQGITGPGVLPSGGGSAGRAAGFPLLPAAALALSGPLAFLAGAAFLWRLSRASQTGRQDERR